VPKEHSQMATQDSFRRFAKIKAVFSPFVLKIFSRKRPFKRKNFRSNQTLLEMKNR
jgi:hypothetical protein